MLKKNEKIDSLAHTRWNCKYHIVLAPKYRQPLIYGQIKSRNVLFIYFLLPYWVPTTWRKRAQTRMGAEFPSGKQPTTLVRRLISRLCRSRMLFVRMRVQCLERKSARSVFPLRRPQFS